MLIQLSPYLNKRNCCRQVFLLVTLFFSCHNPSAAQGGRYWDQNLNSEAALLSGAVVAGEGGIAAIYYNPATIPEMKKTNLSLSANLFSTYYFKAKDALGVDFPADRFQLDIYPRIITLTIKPQKNPDFTIEMAYFTKSNEYMVINKGISSEGDIIASNPGNEYYTGEYYVRSKYQDYNGGAGFGYKLSDKLAVGFTGLISYKDDQYYNLITANAFTMPGPDPSDSRQYLSDSRYHIKYNMYDVRLTTKLGLHLKQNSWSFGANINLPSVKVFGNGTVVKQYEYSNIHREPGNTAGFNRYYAGRQSGCTAHFKDPLSIAAGANYYSPSGRSILLFTAEYFFGLKPFDYIEANHDPGEEGYNFSPAEPQEWLSYSGSQEPVFNAGVAFKRYLRPELMISGGFRTDFRYMDNSDEQGFLENNEKGYYPLNVYHFNSGLGYNFNRGSIILGMQFSYGQDKNQQQVINLSEPVEYISETILPLTGPLNNQVLIRYYDVTIYFGFLFNFLNK